MDKEKLAEQLHIWYLEATHTIPSDAYNMKAQVDYNELSEDQKHIDRYIASAILKLHKQEMLRVIGDNEDYPSGCLYEKDSGEGVGCSNKCDSCIYGYEKGKIEGRNSLRAELRKKVEVDNG
jgi:hypothetical protein